MVTFAKYKVFGALGVCVIPPLLFLVGCASPGDPPVLSGVSVAISPKQGGLAAGQTMELTATVTGDSSGRGVRWSATGGSLREPGATTVMFTAPATAGMVVVTATSVAETTQSASASFGVTNLAGIFTYHNDVARDGVNAREYALTLGNVNGSTFGKLFSCPVDGAVYAQPLWVAGLTIGGTRHNVVFVASTHDTVYAFDADTAPCRNLWSKSLLGAGETWVDQGDVRNSSIAPDIGIIGTPVIDAAAEKLFVVAKSKGNGTSCNVTANCHQRLHGLSLLDGSEPVAAGEIGATTGVPGTGDGAANGVVAFNTTMENQRAGLVLSGGLIYVAWGSHGDNPPYHGWLAAFDESTLALAGIFNATPNGSGGGIWMSGAAPSADENGNLYLLTGNGSFDVASGGSDYGDSTVKLSPKLAVMDYFTPADQQNLDSGDIDHGAGGAAILMDQPAASAHPHLILGGGKDGTMYLLDRDHLGGYGANVSPADGNAVQTFSLGTQILATGAFWNSTFYIGGSFQSLDAFAFNTATGMFNPVSTSQGAGANYGYAGATPSISASGASSNGIVWALDNGQYCPLTGSSCGPTVLHAYDATNLGHELWNSSQAAGERDTAGIAVKFTVPTVANGKVYVGTRGNNQGGPASSTSIPGELDVYGLLPN